MKLILIKNGNMDFPCVAEFTDGTRQMTNSVFRGIGIEYFHYYLVSIGSKKVGDWILNVHSEYNHKEVCKIDNEIELERYGKNKAKIEYSSDPKLEMRQCDDIDSYLNGDHAKEMEVADQKFRKQWNDIVNDSEYNAPIIDKNIYIVSSYENYMNKIDYTPSRKVFLSKQSVKDFLIKEANSANMKPNNLERALTQINESLAFNLCYSYGDYHFETETLSIDEWIY